MILFYHLVEKIVKVQLGFVVVKSVACLKFWNNIEFSIRESKEPIYKI